MVAVRIIGCVAILSVMATSCLAGDNARAVTLDLGDDVTMDFVHIPAGSFLMGSPEEEDGRLADEGPQHRVTIAKPFYIGKYEVTNAQFRRFEPRHNSRWYEEYGKRVDLNSDDQPAVMIHWKHTEWFCDWLNERIKGRFVARLPSEAEWEYVARGGDQRLYPWGNEWPPPPNAGNFADATVREELGKYWDVVPEFRDGFPATAPVGSFKPNPYGVYDMAGNAWEWCLDTWHRNYEGAPADGSAWDPDFVFEKKRLMPMRGGAWHCFRRSLLRTAYRGNIYFKYDAVNRRSIGYDHTGFRVVLIPEL